MEFPVGPGRKDANSPQHAVAPEGRLLEPLPNDDDDAVETQ